MEQLQAALIILAMFLLRLGIPIAMMAAITYGLRRVDARWAAEARAYQQASLWEEQITATPTKPIPSANPPCWVLRGCSPEAQAHCAAGQQPCLPCWLARLRRDHDLPASCVQCQLFALPHPLPVAGD